MFGNTRIKVVLKHFYSDHRQKAFVIINKNWKTVKNLQDHISKMFQIKVDTYLTIDEYLLPPDENIDIINGTDTITVHPSTTNLFSQLADAFSHAHINTTPASEISSPGFQKQTKKRKKDSSAPDVTADDVLARVTPSPNKCSKWIQDINSLDVQRTDDSSAIKIEETNTTAMGDANSLKVKRPRKRKRKNKTLEIVVAGVADAKRPKTPAHEFATPFATFPQNGVSFNKSNIHIRFQGAENANTIETATESTEEQVQLPTIARVIRASCSQINMKLDTNQLQKTSQFQIPKIVKNDLNTVEREKVIEDTVKENATSVNIKNESALEQLRTNIPQLNLNALVGKAKENDVLAFRLLKLNESYIPEMSEYIIGTVSQIDDTDGSITIQVLAGAEETKEPSGKFSMAEYTSEENADENAEKIITLQQSELLDVKYVPHEL